MKLYPYQEEAVSHAVTALGERGNSLIVAGTGAGKTIMMAAAIGRFFDGFRALHGRSPHILVLVHRNEIHSQNHRKFSLVRPDIAASEITAARKSLHGYVHFGMVQTVQKLLTELELSNSYFDLIVVDEAHHSAATTYKEIIEWNSCAKQEAALLGVTATPNRGDKLPLIELFDNFYQITTRFLIDSHYLVRPKILDLSPVFLNTKKEPEKGHLAKNCRHDTAGDKLIQELCEEYLRRKEEGKSIIFAPNHDFCERILACLNIMGQKVAYLAPMMNESARRTEIEKFEKGECDELINVDICTEGYDFPPLRNLVDFDTNGTHGQWVQKVGRVLRTAPGKTSCTVIDFGGNVSLYPDGVDCDVALEGAVKVPAGQRLKEEDLFKELKERSEKFTSDIIRKDDEEYTPYHLPNGFESVSDNDFGIVFVACGDYFDFVITPTDGEDFALYKSDKLSIILAKKDSFSKCIKIALEEIKKINYDPRPISRMQIKLLAPEYPTTALDRYGANCCISWKLWKNEIKESLSDV